MAQAILESGIKRAVSTNTDYSIVFQNTFIDPVVIATIVSLPNRTTVARAKNVTATGFDLRLTNDNASAETLIDVSWIVVEKGRWKVKDVTFEAGVFDSTSSIEYHPTNVSLYREFIPEFHIRPLIFSTLQTINNTDMFGTIIQDRSKHGFRLTLDALETSYVPTLNDTIGWLAITPGSFTQLDNLFEASEIIPTYDWGRDGTGITHVFSSSYPSEPSVISNIQLQRGESAVVSGELLTNNNIVLYATEDEIGDLEQNHLPYTDYYGIDSSIYNNDLLYTGITQSSNKPPHLESSISIDGTTGSYAEVSKIPEYSSSSFTIEGWIYRHLDTEAGEPLFSFSSTTDYDVLFNISALNNDEIQLYFKDTTGATHQVGAGTTVSSRRWQHIAGSFDGTILSVYLNGSLGDSGNFSSWTPRNIFTHFYIGRRGGVYGFNGDMADVRVWNYARTETEIRENMYRTLSGDEAGLVGYWKFDRETIGVLSVDSTATIYDIGVQLPSTPPVQKKGIEIFNGADSYNNISMPSKMIGFESVGEFIPDSTAYYDNGVVTGVDNLRLEPKQDSNNNYTLVEVNPGTFVIGGSINRFDESFQLDINDRANYFGTEASTTDLEKLYLTTYYNTADATAMVEIGFYPRNHRYKFYDVNNKYCLLGILNNTVSGSTITNINNIRYIDDNGELKRNNINLFDYLEPFEYNNNYISADAAVVSTVAATGTYGNVQQKQTLSTYLNTIYSVVYYLDGVSYTSINYSLDNGNTWSVYNDSSLNGSGVYSIIAVPGGAFIVADDSLSFGGSGYSYIGFFDTTSLVEITSHRTNPTTIATAATYYRGDFDKYNNRVVICDYISDSVDGNGLAIYTSADNGTTWANKYRYDSVVGEPIGPRNAYVASDGWIYIVTTDLKIKYSNNLFDSWNTIDISAFGSLTTLSRCIVENGALIYSRDTGGFYISFDRGLTWKTITVADMGSDITHISNIHFDGINFIVIGYNLGSSLPKIVISKNLKVWNYMEISNRTNIYQFLHSSISTVDKRLFINGRTTGASPYDSVVSTSLRGLDFKYDATGNFFEKGVKTQNDPTDPDSGFSEEDEGFGYYFGT